MLADFVLDVDLLISCLPTKRCQYFQIGTLRLQIFPVLAVVIISLFIAAAEDEHDLVL